MKSTAKKKRVQEFLTQLSTIGQVDIHTPWVMRLMAVVTILILSMLIL